MCYTYPRPLYQRFIQCIFPTGASSHQWMDLEQEKFPNVSIIIDIGPLNVPNSHLVIFDCCWASGFSDYSPGWTNAIPHVVSESVTRGFVAIVRKQIWRSCYFSQTFYETNGLSDATMQELRIFYNTRSVSFIRFDSSVFNPDYKIWTFLFNEWEGYFFSTDAKVCINPEILLLPEMKKLWKKLVLYILCQTFL